MKLFIGVPCSDLGRYRDFDNCLQKLVKPDDTIIHYQSGASIAKNRNIIIRLAMQNNCTHLLFLDDDMVFEPDLFVQLLAHNVDVVSAHCLIRYPPFKSALVDGFDFGNNLILHDLKLNETGLIPIWATGLAAVLIRCEILEKFVEYTAMGFLHHDETSEDISFYMRLHEAGYNSYCDLDCHVGHHINSVIWPGGKITVNNQEITNAVLLRREAKSK